uniref:Uncharacterized protein n=1 Tax=Otus sunia TaxID=257818 RepID=A0A8C8AKY7_9STRI
LPVVDTNLGETKPSQVSANLSLGLCILSAGRRFGTHLCLRCGMYSRMTLTILQPGRVFFKKKSAF